MLPRELELDSSAALRLPSAPSRTAGTTGRARFPCSCPPREGPRRARREGAVRPPQGVGRRRGGALGCVAATSLGRRPGRPPRTRAATVRRPLAAPVRRPQAWWALWPGRGTVCMDGMGTRRRQRPRPELGRWFDAGKSAVHGATAGGVGVQRHRGGEQAGVGRPDRWSGGRARSAVPRAGIVGPRDGAGRCRGRTGGAAARPGLSLRGTWDPRGSGGSEAGRCQTATLAGRTRRASGGAPAAAQ